MTLRELINQATGNVALGEYLKDFKELNYDLNIFDIDLQRLLDVDPKVTTDHLDNKIILKVEQ